MSIPRAASSSWFWLQFIYEWLSGFGSMKPRYIFQYNDWVLLLASPGPAGPRRQFGPLGWDCLLIEGPFIIRKAAQMTAEDDWGAEVGKKCAGARRLGGFRQNFSGHKSLRSRQQLNYHFRKFYAQKTFVQKLFFVAVLAKQTRLLLTAFWGCQMVKLPGF